MSPLRTGDSLDTGDSENHCSTGIVTTVTTVTSMYVCACRKVFCIGFRKVVVTLVTQVTSGGRFPCKLRQN